MLMTIMAWVPKLVDIGTACCTQVSSDSAGMVHNLKPNMFASIPGLQQAS